MKDIRDFDEKDIIDSEKKFIWTLASVPCPKPFDGMLLFAKRSKTVEEIFEENKALILESAQQMMETEN